MNLSPAAIAALRARINAVAPTTPVTTRLTTPEPMPMDTHKPAFDDGPHPFSARSVSQRSRHKSFFGPTTVAIHDDAHVFWQGTRIQTKSLVKRHHNSTGMRLNEKAAESGLFEFQIL